MLAISASFRKSLACFASNEQGATAIEYGLIAAMMCVALIASATVLSGSFDAMWSYVQSHLVEALAP